MLFELLATLEPALWTGLALGVMLIATGLGIGLTLGRFLFRRPPVERAESQQVLKLVEELSRWTSHVSSDVTEYRGLVEDLTEQVEQQSALPGDPSQLDTAGLLSQMLDANRRLQRRLDTAEATLRHQAHEIAAYMSEARTDALTRLNNRRVFDEALASSLTALRTQGKAVAVVLIDVDHFKRLNDTHGHLAGDAVLQGLAKILRDQKPSGAVSARYGGEEFALVVHQRDLQEVCAAAQMIRHEVQTQGFMYEQKQLKVTISCGVALAMLSEETSSLVKRCDEALYAAKSAGRNAVFLHDGYRSLAFSPTQSLVEEDSREEQLARDFQEVCQELRSRLQQVAVTEGEASEQPLTMAGL